LDIKVRDGAAHWLGGPAAVVISVGSENSPYCEQMRKRKREREQINIQYMT